MKIVELRPGQKARIKEIKKGVSGQRRLFEMGLLPGTELKLVSSHPFHGPLVLQIGNSKVALGRGMAEAVEVELLEE